MIRVLVYDDSPHIAEGWVNKIQGACSEATVRSAKHADFQDLMGEIAHRRAAWRDSSDEKTPIERTNVDNAHIVVVDYDLLHYSEAADITGSRLAYLLRCFTTCGLIVILNEYGTNTFDLNLRSPSQGFADLHLGAQQISNPGLWTRSFEGYRPWHWPVLPDARENFERCVQDVQKHPDQPILDFFGLDRFIDWLPKRAHDFVLGSEDIESICFRTFANDTRGGIDSKDKLLSDFSARVTAARLITLLNGLILPEQNLLVDAPHLASRFPSLIRDEGQDLDIRQWNRLCDPSGEKIDDLFEAHLTERRFKQQHWLWKPAWYWPQIVKDERIAEVKNPWTVKDLDWVFCENISQFIPAEFSDSFIADVTPPFNRRYVLRSKALEALSFVPKVGSGESQDPLIVEYIPQAAFSL